MFGNLLLKTTSGSLEANFTEMRGGSKLLQSTVDVKQVCVFSCVITSLLLNNKYIHHTNTHIFTSDPCPDTDNGIQLLCVTKCMSGIVFVMQCIIHVAGFLHCLITCSSHVYLWSTSTSRCMAARQPFPPIFRQSILPHSFAVPEHGL